MAMLWVVTIMHVFAGSSNVSLCIIMQGPVSNFEDFQFCPYCPSLNCYKFSASADLSMEVISNSAIESSLSFNIKSMQQKEKEKKLPRTISKWWYKKKVTLFSKFLSFSTSSLTLLPWGSEVTSVKTKPQYSLFNLVSKSKTKAPEKLLNACAVSWNFYACFCRIL